MSLQDMSLTDLQNEIKRRQSQAAKLQGQRDRLAAEIAALDKDLAAFGISGTSIPTRRKVGRPAGSGATGGTKRTRTNNSIALPDAIAAAMEVHAVVSPLEAAELVRKNGYVTTSKTFNMQVSNALAKDARFKRLSRGQYERVK